MKLKCSQHFKCFHWQLCRRVYRPQRGVHGKFRNYSTVISNDMIGCCVVFNYSSITFHISDFLFSISSRSSDKGRKWQHIQSQSSSTKPVCYRGTRPFPFFLCPSKESGLSLFILYRNLAFRAPLALTAQTQTTLSLSHPFHAFPPFFHRSIFLN